MLVIIEVNDNAADLMADVVNWHNDPNRDRPMRITSGGFAINVGQVRIVGHTTDRSQNVLERWRDSVRGKD